MDNNSSQEDNKMLNEWMDRYEREQLQSSNGSSTSEHGKYEYAGSMTQQYNSYHDGTHERSSTQ